MTPTPTPTPIPTGAPDALADPAFWVNVAIAIGTIGSVVLAVVLAWRAWLSERRRREAAEAEAARVEAARIEAQALVLYPGPGVMWWIAREHEPTVTLRHLMRLRLRPGDDQPQWKDSMFIAQPQQLGLNGRMGVGVGLAPGDYLEVHWTEDDTGRELSNGVRIGDPNAVHFIANGQRGH